MKATEARRLAESNLFVLFDVIEKTSKEGYTGLKLHNKNQNGISFVHYDIPVLVLFNLVKDNETYLKTLGYEIKKSLFGQIKGISWEQV